MNEKVNDIPKLENPNYTVRLKVELADVYYKVDVEANDIDEAIDKAKKRIKPLLLGIESYGARIPDEKGDLRVKSVTASEEDVSPFGRVQTPLEKLEKLLAESDVSTIGESGIRSLEAAIERIRRAQKKFT